MTLIFRYMTIFCDITKWNKWQTKWDRWNISQQIYIYIYIYIYKYRCGCEFYECGCDKLGKRPTQH